MNTTNSHPVHKVYDGQFDTASGKKIDIMFPEPAMFDINDVAHALSHICRFGGHSSQFYSVAQHSVFVAAMAPEELRKEALMHDATEAYLGDVIKPLKVILGDVYANIEDAFTMVIAQKFDLSHHKLHLVKKFDLKALEFEYDFLVKDSPIPFLFKMSELGLVVDSHVVWSPVVAKEMFLKFFNRYFN